MLCDDTTVGEWLTCCDITSKVVLRFIQSNELERLSDQTSDQIKSYIRNILIENGFVSDSFNSVFLIYRFFLK